jgi:hypothetical protein
MSDPEKTVCEACGGELERFISRTAFSLKGSGWYKDLYSSAKPEAKTTETKTETKTDAPKADAPKADAPKAEPAKPAKPDSGGSGGGSGTPPAAAAES